MLWLPQGQVSRLRGGKLATLGGVSANAVGFWELLYSTASYGTKDLAGIGLASNNLTGWSFAGQNLVSADSYYATLKDTNLSGANLASADLGSATLAQMDAGKSSSRASLHSNSVLMDSSIDRARSAGRQDRDTAGHSTVVRGCSQVGLRLPEPLGHQVGQPVQHVLRHDRRDEV